MSLRDPRLDEQSEEMTISLNVWAARTIIHAEMCMLAMLLFHACLAPTPRSLSRVLFFGLLFLSSLDDFQKTPSDPLEDTKDVLFSAGEFLRPSFARSLDPCSGGFGQLDVVVAN